MLQRASAGAVEIRPSRERPASGALIASWLACTLAGAIIVALPDEGPRVVSLSGTHGPGALDVAGLALVAAGLVAHVAVLVRGRDALRARARTPAAAFIALVAALAAALTAWSVRTDAGAWWAAGAGALFVVQGVLAAAAASDAPAPVPRADSPRGEA